MRTMVLSWVGRLVGIAAVLASPLVARAAEATEEAPAAKAHHAVSSSSSSTGHAHAKKRSIKRGTRHEHEAAVSKSDAKSDAKPAKSTKPAKATAAAPKDDDSDVTEQVAAERASTKSPPKPSKTPLPTIAAAACAPRMEAMSTSDAPIEKAEKIAKVAKVDSVGHGIEPRRTPILRATIHGDGPLRAEHRSRRTKAPCLHAPVDVMRGAEEESFALTKCDGSVAPLAIEEMSVLVRPGSAAKPSEPVAALASKADKKDSDELAPGIKRIDGRLVERLQLMVDHFAKGKTPKVFVVSGYRPTSKGSFHATGRAIDFRLDGVENTDLVAFCKTLDDTGCGFYPNSSFIHMDVRDAGTGRVAWIDASAPGEKPEYVSAWPPPPKQDDDDPVKILAKLDELQLLPTEEASDRQSAKTAEDSKADDADSEPGVLLKPIVEEKRRATTDE